LYYDPYDDVKDPMPIEYKGEEGIEFELKNATSIIIMHADPTISFDADMKLMNTETNQTVDISSHGFLDQSDDLYEIIAQSSIPAGKYKLMMKLIKQN
jgi:hypothetical protein